MSRLRAVSALGGVTAGLLLACLSGPAYAGGGLQRCLDQAAEHNGEPPTCTRVDGAWVASWPDDGSAMGSGGGVPGAFVGLVVVGLLVAVGITIWKVTTAQSLARQSGMDPGLATQMTLLSDDGLDATYLASSLRQPTAPAAPAAPVATSPDAAGAEARLAELTGLLDKGLVTQAEYDERRKAIIDSV
jgi:hypothetical protein